MVRGLLSETITIEKLLQGLHWPALSSRAADPDARAERFGESLGCHWSFVFRA